MPAFVTDYMKKNRITLKSGTIVVWEKPDKLSARSASKLREQMLDDFPSFPNSRLGTAFQQTPFATVHGWEAPATVTQLAAGAKRSF